MHTNRPVVNCSAPRALGSLVLLALVVAGSGCVGRGSHGWNFNLSALDAVVERSEQHALDLGPDERLVLSSTYGSIEIVVDPTAPPSLRAEVRARGTTNAAAQSALDRARVDIEHVAGALSVAFVVEAADGANDAWREQFLASADFFVTVPSLTNVAATTSDGSITTRGQLGPVRLETRYGDIAIDRVQGDVFAKSSSGSIAAAELAGDELSLECSYGDLTVGSASGGSLVMHSSSGNIELSRAEVDRVSLVTNYGDIRASRVAGSLTANSSSGAIDITGFVGDIEATSQYGNVDIEGQLTGVVVKAASGDIDVRATDGSRALSDWKLASSYGNVTLRAPADFACRLDATTNYGDIECGFGMFVEAGARSGRRLSGTIGTGGPSVVLATSSGNVAMLAR